MTVLEDREEVPAHSLRIANREGDIRIGWDPTSPDEVEHARTQFRKLTGRASEGGQGYFAYRVGDGGRRNEQVREFDPNARELVLTPQLVGG